MNNIKTISWRLIYILSEIIIVYFLKFHINNQFLFQIIGLCGLAHVFVIIFAHNYNRNLLFFESIYIYLIMIFLGLFLNKYLTRIDVTYLGITLMLVNILGFMPFGKKFINDFLTNNSEILYKLMIYGKDRKNNLYDTSICLEYLFLAIWLASFGTSPIMLVIIGIAYILGTIINQIIIYNLHKRLDFHGLPSVIVPFICILTFYLMFRNYF